jgi:hypothetical protein
MVNDTARIKKATIAARKTGSRGSPRTCPPPPLPFGILILIANSLTLPPEAIQTAMPLKRFDGYSTSRGCLSLSLPTGHNSSFAPLVSCHSEERSDEQSASCCTAISNNNERLTYCTAHC